MINLLLAINGKQRGRRKRAVARANKPSRRAEVAYREDLLKIVRQLRNQVDVRLKPALLSLEHQYANKHTFATDGYASDLLAAFDAMSVAMGGIQSLATRLATLAVTRTLEDADKSLAQGIGRSLGIDALTTIRSLNVRSQIEHAVTMNAELIKSLPTQGIERIKTKVLLNVGQGKRYTEIAKEIEGELGVTERRAKLIARDQTAKVNAAITEAKQQALGIVSYVWETAGDERVRETHRENDGKEFRWDDPPSETGHPGDDINCRCIARPVIKFEDDDE